MGLCSYPNQLPWQPPVVAPLPAGEVEQEVEPLYKETPAGEVTEPPDWEAPPPLASRARIREPCSQPSASESFTGRPSELLGSSSWGFMLVYPAGRSLGTSPGAG